MRNRIKRRIGINFPVTNRSLLCFAVGTLLCACLFSGMQGNEIHSLSRKDGESDHTHITLEAVYGGQCLSEDLSVEINPREKSREEKRSALTDYAEGLAESILNGNESTRAIVTSLALAERNGDYRVEWTSSRPDLIDSDGKISYEALFSDPEGETGIGVLLTAFLTYEDIYETIEIPITVRKPGTEEEIGRFLSENIAGWKQWIKGSTEETVLTLLSETDTGIILSWKEKRTPLPAFAFLLLSAFAFFLYGERRKKPKKEKLREKKEILDAYPFFLDEMVLYLNAGLATENAIERICLAHGKEENCFYRELNRMNGERKESNASFRSLFYTFGRERELTDILRFSSVLEDSVRKGVDVAEKLELEAFLLRTREERKTDERGRTLETKLSFPMLLLLIALLIVTVSPAIYEMHA